MLFFPTFGMRNQYHFRSRLVSTMADDGMWSCWCVVWCSRSHFTSNAILLLLITHHHRLNSVGFSSRLNVGSPTSRLRQVCFVSHNVQCFHRHHHNHYCHYDVGFSRLGSRQSEESSAAPLLLESKGWTQSSCLCVCVSLMVLSRGSEWNVVRAVFPS
jgi:hypothetical protein